MRMMSTDSDSLEDASTFQVEDNSSLDETPAGHTPTVPNEVL